MNIKELASFTGKDARTIRRWIAKAGDKISQVPLDKMSQGIPHDYTIDEVEAILIAGTLSKGAITILMENAKGTQLVEAINYDAIGRMIGMAVTAALTPIVQELREIKTIKMLPEPVKETSYSLVAYCRVKEISINRSDLTMHGKELKKIAIEKRIKVKKIPDERWGFVNSYPVEILDEYFAL